MPRFGPSVVFKLPDTGVDTLGGDGLREIRLAGARGTVEQHPTPRFPDACVGGCDRNVSVRTKFTGKAKATSGKFCLSLECHNYVRTLDCVNFQKRHVHRF